MEKIFIDYEGNLRSRLTQTSHDTVLYIDAPKENGGLGASFSPTDLLAAALASCIVTVITLAAKRYGVEIVKLKATIEKTMTSIPQRRIASLTFHLYCEDILEESLIQILEKAAHTCPVHNSLHKDIEQHLTFHWKRS
ncbi:OsmC family protein [Rhabdochlamydiaceae symbiont of Dictyostelium giganteum]|uniref:OsmC family protein n=1 Tax=Rhabdochlamydiaceae symbiont of Dictyostelium giganteum TaxID=3342349 RepID=UPI00384B8DC4